MSLRYVCRRKGGREKGRDGALVLDLVCDYCIVHGVAHSVEIFSYSLSSSPPSLPLLHAHSQPKTFLRPAAFEVAHTIFYEGEGDEDVYSTTFFNQSILVVAPSATK
jgi:hypothetical protein